MAREKATITLNRAKAAEARQLLGTANTSEVIDVALDLLIHTERLKADLMAYRAAPTTTAEVALASFSDTSSIADDTDWESFYPDDLS